MKALNVYLSCVLAAASVTGWAVAPVGAEQQAPQLQQEVERSLGDDDFERIEVSVTGSEVTLSGTVPHLLAKNQAIGRALEVAGVETVASELQLPVEEEDDDVAEEVGKAISRYPHFTIWDYIEGRINQGVVTLHGSVTPMRDKKGELYETIAKIRGVQDYVDEIEVQSSSSGGRPATCHHRPKFVLKPALPTNRENAKPSVPHRRQPQQCHAVRVCPDRDRVPRDGANHSADGGYPQRRQPAAGAALVS